LKIQQTKLTGREGQLIRPLSLVLGHLSLVTDPSFRFAVRLQGGHAAGPELVPELVVLAFEFRVILQHILIPFLTAKDAKIAKVFCC